MKIFKLSTFLLVVGMFLAVVLAGVNMLTKDKIAQNAEDVVNESLKKGLYEAEEFCKVNEAEDCLEDIELTSEVKSIYVGSKDDETVGYAYELETTNGFGTFSILLGLNNDGVVVGYQTLTAGQTPGYGKDLLEGSKLLKTILDLENSSVSDVSSGATFTGNSVQSLIDAAIEHFNNYLGGE